MVETTPAPPQEGNGMLQFQRRGLVCSNFKGGDWYAPISLLNRTPNLNPDIVNPIADKLGLKFVPEKNFPSTEVCGDSTLSSTILGAFNSPPSEGCPKGGVVGGVAQNPKGGVVVTTINNTPIYRNFVENLPHNPELKQLAKDKRKAGILSEVLFWQRVHKGKFHNMDFDRQRIIGNYIVDFYVKTLGLIIEIDGCSHNAKEEYDSKRQAYLENLGLVIYRIADSNVKNNLDGVIKGLEQFIMKTFENICNDSLLR